MNKITRVRVLLSIIIIFISVFFFTPKAQASTIVTDDITSDTTWTLSGSPYVLLNYINVYQGTTLTIQPGVIVKSSTDDGLSVTGSLIANGTLSQPIIFTSYKDDSVGGDTNADGVSYPAARDWKGLYINDPTSRSVFSHIIFNYSYSPFYISDTPTFNMTDFRASNFIYGPVFANNTNGVVDGYYVENGRNNFDICNNSSVTMNNFDIGYSTMFEAVTVSEDSSLTMTNGVFHDISDNGIAIYDSGHISLNHVTFTRVDGTAISEYGNDMQYYGSNSISIINSKIQDANWAFSIYDGHTILNINHNSISGNNYGVFNDTFDDNTNTYTNLNFANNWWGDASGPYNQISNPSGLGDEVSDEVTVSPWLTSDPLLATHNPVIIVPGLIGTQILKNYSDHSEIWPNITTLITSISDSFLTPLALNSNGTENSTYPMALGDILRSVAGKDIFAGLITNLTSSGYTEGTNLFVFPYDWRKSDVDDAVLLKNKIDAVLAQTGATKVDLIAHSMGGLVAKSYIAQNGTGSVGKMIFIGTPHLGAPKSFKALMYGDDMGFHFGIELLSSAEVKLFSQNFPSAFDLIPSRKYVDGENNFLGTKYVNDATTNTGGWLSYNQTKTFMTTAGRNNSLFSQAESLHSATDDLDMTGADVYNFSGCGGKTIGRITATKEKSWTSLWQKVVDDYQLGYTDGDETVPVLSSAGTYTHQYYIKGYSHALLPSANGVPDTILSILSGNTIPTYQNISTNNSFCGISGKVVSSHSPVTLDVYDNAGNHTGPTSTGDIEYGIPGVAYDIVGDAKFAFLPDGGDYKVVNKATDTGAYNFFVQTVNASDQVTNTEYFNQIPLNTMQTNSEVDISPNTTNNVVKIDQTGDGIFENTIQPSAVLDATKSLDTTAPVTKMKKQDGKIKFTASDDNSGVLKIEYSVNKGATWKVYTKPFEADVKKIWYFSTDKAGNAEAVNVSNKEDKDSRHKYSKYEDKDENKYYGED